MKNPLKHFLLAGCFSLLGINVFGISGQDMFDESYVHEIRITFAETNYWQILTDNYNNPNPSTGDVNYLMATSITVDGNLLDSVGVKQKGYFSNWGAFGSQKKPLKIDFKEYKNQKYDGLKKINLANGFEDPSMMRDVLAYRIFREMGLDAPRTSYAKVYLNNQYWGLYIIIEQYDSEFLEDHFPLNSDGDLYKCSGNTNLDYNGPNWSSYTSEFELKTNELTSDHARFIDFVKKINQTPTSTFLDSLETIFETSDYLAILACDVLMYNWDSYYDHGRNFYMYLDPITNKFNWLPWDYNLAFSNTTTNIIINYSFGSTPKPLVQKMQANSTYKTMYFERICHILLNKFNLTALEDFIDNTAALIRPDLDADPNKFFTISEFDQNITSTVNTGGGGFGGSYPGIKSFITSRMTTVMNQLNSNGFTCVLEVEQIDPLNEWNIYPNPVQEGFLTIEVGNNEVENIQIFDISGQLVYNGTASGEKSQVDFSGFENGMYIVQVNFGDHVSTKKVVKR